MEDRLNAIIQGLTQKSTTKQEIYRNTREAFNLFKKDKIDWVTLREPNDSVSFFETIKKEAKYWRSMLS